MEVRMEKDEIYNKLKACVGEILLIEEEELIQPDTHLIDDLGAESIDFIEIIHSLSGIFDVQIERNEIYPDRDYFTNKQYVSEDLSITPEGLDKLFSSWPHLNKDKVKDSQELGQYLNSIAVLVDFFEYKLNTR
jgi:acyl carrier protein